VDIAIMSAVPVLLMLFGAVMKVIKAAPVVEGFAAHGLGENFVVPIGILELFCVVVYLIPYLSPQTSVRGAILMTGLLGGATITGLRAGDPTFPIPVVLGMMAWGGLFLRADPAPKGLAGR
jgi:DoxX-like family